MKTYPVTPASSVICAKHQMSPEVAQKWRQNGVKMTKRGGNGVFEQKPQQKRQKRNTEADAGLLDSLMISANYRTSSQVAQKWRNEAEMTFFEEKS